MEGENRNVQKLYPEGSFQRIFWDQQLEAAKYQKACNMKWHPLMIKWCLYLRYKSSGAYELLRESGCVKLPSQRTLRDYTHVIKKATGFSLELDAQLMKAADIECLEMWQKCVMLILDEMKIREDLVYDKCTDELIGFTDLGDINNHLLQFEKSLQDQQTPTLAAKHACIHGWWPFHFATVPIRSISLCKHNWRPFIQPCVGSSISS